MTTGIFAGTAGKIRCCKGGKIKIKINLFFLTINVVSQMENGGRHVKGCVEIKYNVLGKNSSQLIGPLSFTANRS